MVLFGFGELCVLFDQASVGSSQLFVLSFE